MGQVTLLLLRGCRIDRVLLLFLFVALPPLKKRVVARQDTVVYLMQIGYLLCIQKTQVKGRGV